MLVTSAFYTTSSIIMKLLPELSELRVVPTLLISCFDEGLTIQISAPYTTYGDDFKHFNLELSKLRVVPSLLIS